MTKPPAKAEPRLARLLVGGFFILCGLAAASGGLYAIATDVAFFARAEAVDGRVEQMRTEWRRRSRVHVADIHFVTTAGEEIRIPALRPNSWMRHAAGDTVLVRYDPADPATASIESLPLRVLGAMIALPFGTIFATFGWMLAAGRPRWPIGVFIASGVTLAVLLAALLAANEIEEFRAIQRASAVAEGEVIGHRRITRSSAGGSAETLFAPRIRFTTQDNQLMVVEPLAPTRRAEPPPGTRVTLHYRRDQPERATPDPPRAGWLRPVAAVTLPLLAIAMGLVLLARRRRGRRRA
jgi:hypothetical protein